MANDPTQTTIDEDAERVIRRNWDHELHRECREKWGKPFMDAIDRALVRMGVIDDR